MYFSYSYYTMKPKPNLLRSNYIASTSSSDYSGWQSQFEDHSWRNWSKLANRYAEDFQFALLRGMTLVGIACYDWDSVFGDIYNEHSPFQGLAKAFLQGHLTADWRSFAKKIALETYKSNHYPAVCPEWLFGYGYTQAQYLQDLAVYWDGIHDDYYKAWDTTRIGQDSPEMARLKKLGAVARQEIDQVARHSTQTLKR